MAIPTAISIILAPCADSKNRAVLTPGDVRHRGLHFQWRSLRRDRYEAVRQNEKLRTVLETAAGARQLIDAGKCVIWAGPREIARAGSARVDAADMNTWLRDLQSQFPGPFH